MPLTEAQRRASLQQQLLSSKSEIANNIRNDARANAATGTRGTDRNGFTGGDKGYIRALEQNRDSAGAQLDSMSGPDLLSMSGISDELLRRLRATDKLRSQPR